LELETATVSVEAYEYDGFDDYAVLEIEGVEGVGRVELTRRDLPKLAKFLNEVTDIIDW
jgi:hypothetical protein